jgi:hypothetical protein
LWEPDGLAAVITDSRNGLKRAFRQAGEPLQ